MKRYGLLILLTLAVGAVWAQEERSAQAGLVFGDVVEGEISDSLFEVFYDFQGVQGDVVLLEVTSLAEDNAFQWPEVILMTDEREPLADSTEFIEITRTVVAATLPYTGNYEILVTRDDGRAGEGVGPYVLRVVQPTVLRPSETVPGNVVNDKNLAYYVVREDGPFSVYYEFAGGELDPQIIAHRVEPDGQLIDLATVTGNGFVSTSIGLDGSDSDLYIITVGDSFYASYFDNRVETADYRLRLLVNDPN